MAKWFSRWRKRGAGTDAPARDVSAETEARDAEEAPGPEEGTDSSASSDEDLTAVEAAVEEAGRTEVEPADGRPAEAARSPAPRR